MAELQPVGVLARQRIRAAERTATKAAKRPPGRTAAAAAALGTSGTTLPRSSTPVNQQLLELPRNINRAGRRALHAAHRQSPRKYKPLTKAERRQRSRLSRQERHLKRFLLRQFTNLRSVRRCGAAAIPVRDKDGNKLPGKRTLRVTTGEDGSRTAGYGGLQHCGSVWACPVCSATVATRRAQEIAKVLRWALEQGYSASFMTLTLRHFEGHRLRDVWNAVSKGWAAATGGRKWVAEQQEYGLEGWVKVVEATHGANGWHVHLHVLLIWDRGTDAATMHEAAAGVIDGQEVSVDECRDALTLSDATELGEAMHRRWTSAVQKLGFDSLKDSGGLDVRLASLEPSANGLHQYFTKMAFEVSGGYAKQAKGKGRAPFQILNDALATGLMDDIELWWDWEQGSRARRQIAWGGDIRERAGLGEEQTDEDVANEEMPAQEAITLTDQTSAYLVNCPEAETTLLEVAEDGGLDAACAWLDTRGLMWHSRRTLDPPDTPA